MIIAMGNVLDPEKRRSFWIDRVGVNAHYQAPSPITTKLTGNTEKRRRRNSCCNNKESHPPGGVECRAPRPLHARTPQGRLRVWTGFRRDTVISWTSCPSWRSPDTGREAVQPGRDSRNITVSPSGTRGDSGGGPGPADGADPSQAQGRQQKQKRTEHVPVGTPPEILEVVTSVKRAKRMREKATWK